MKQIEINKLPRDWKNIHYKQETDTIEGFIVGFAAGGLIWMIAFLFIGVLP